MLNPAKQPEPDLQQETVIWSQCCYHGLDTGRTHSALNHSVVCLFTANNKSFQMIRAAVTLPDSPVALHSFQKLK